MKAKLSPSLQPWRLCRPFPSRPKQCLLLRLPRSPPRLDCISSTRHFSASSVLLHQDYASYMDASQKLCEDMKVCASLQCPLMARALHSHLISSGFHTSLFLQNYLLHMYSRCGLIDDASRVFFEIQSPNVFSYNTMFAAWGSSGRLVEAQRLFDEMPHRDTVSWNSLMSAYFNNGRSADAIVVFVTMVYEMGPTCCLNPFSVSCVLKSCGTLGYFTLARQLHSVVAKAGSFFHHDSIDSSLIDMYIKCGAFDLAERIFSRIQNPSLFCCNSMIYTYSKLYNIAAAVDFFHKMPERDAVSWSTVISLLSKHACNQALSTFVDMCALGFRPNSMTYACVLSAGASLCDLEWGTHLHARILRVEPGLDVYTGSGLIDLYVKCGCLKTAKRVFVSLEARNVVSWTSFISGVVQLGSKDEALVLFNQMRRVPLPPDRFTIATVLGVCSAPEDIPLGMQLHGCLVKGGFDQSVTVGNALLTMYASCRDIQSANLVFDSILYRDVISWTAMVAAFSQRGDVKMARVLFDEMPERNIVSWSSMLATYVQRGLWEEGVKLYILMLRQGVVPDWMTFAILLSACADSTLSRLGEQIMSQVEKIGFGLDVSVANSAITMYSKCAQIHEAQRIFDLVSLKNLVTWNSMMTAYAQNGLGRKVIGIFEDMLKAGYTPDHISFLSLLTGCSHAGLVKEGCHYLNAMMKDHGISPAQEHLNCMVDLLGRAGLLDQAKTLIDKMPFKADTTAWGTLLGACRNYNNKRLAEYATRKLLELDFEGSGLYTLMTNIYSVSGDSEEVADLRKFLKDKGMQKNPGCSWTEVDSRVHVFTSSDACHPEMDNVLRVLEMIVREVEDDASCSNKDILFGFI